MNRQPGSGRSAQQGHRRGMVPTWRILVGATALVTVSVTALATTGASPAVPAPADVSTSPRPEASDAEKIEPRLQHQLETTDSAELWVRFDDEADLTEAGRIADWAEHGAAVAAALKQTAEASQTEVRRRLDAAGVEY